MDYLSFLEETVLFSDKYILPNFVKSLNDSPNCSIHRERKDEPVVSANTTWLRTAQPSKDAPNSKGNQQPTENPKASDDGQEAPPPPRANKKKEQQTEESETKLPQIVYRLTTCDEHRNGHAMDPPLGPLIEYMAHKTGSPTERILYYVTVLDKELRNHSRSSQASGPTILLPPEEVLDRVMSERML
jgi:hypothetical protein